MKILITGGRGQLGHDCTGILNKNHDVVSIDIEDLDISNRQAVDACINKIQPDLIINCAAFTQVDECETRQELAREVNTEGPGNIAKCSAKFNSRLIHISTDYVFDGNKKPTEPYLETDQTAPGSIYGKTKLAGENAVIQNSNNYIILRTAWLYGFSGHNFIKAIINKAISAPENPLKIINDQFGSPTWSYRLALQIEHLIGRKARGIFHATSEGHCTWYEFAEYFLTKTGIPHTIVPCTSEEYPLPAARPKNSILENMRLKEEGLNLMEPWQADLDLYIEQYGEQLIQNCQS